MKRTRSMLGTLLLVLGCQSPSEGSSAGSSTSDNTTGSTAETSTTVDSMPDTSSSSGTSPTTSGGPTSSGSPVGSDVSDSESSTSEDTGVCTGVCEPGSDPFDGLGCSDDCEIDFSEVTQWFCADGCSPLGQDVLEYYCGPEHADLFCKLLTGEPEATAKTWAESSVVAGPGFCCLGWDDDQVDLGPLPKFGIDHLCYQETDMLATYGLNFAIRAEDVECVVP